MIWFKTPHNGSLSADQCLQTKRRFFHKFDVKKPSKMPRKGRNDKRKADEREVIASKNKKMKDFFP